jgi:prepilin-type N-terminal cleavage/methylation domain-containing protein
MIKRNNKKGFTIVELVIVIAVIAILAAVLIPTFSSIIAKANQSADISAVTQMNKVLAGNNYKDISEVAKALTENGFNADDTLVPVSKDHAYYWFPEYNTIILVNESEGTWKLIAPTSDKELVNAFNATTKGSNAFVNLKVTGAKTDVNDSASIDAALSAGQNITLTANPEKITASNAKYTSDGRPAGMLVPEGEVVAIDLGGKTLEADPDAVALAIKGEAVITNGTISTRSIVVEAGGKLTIGEGVKVVASATTGGQCIRNLGGVVTINGGTFEAMNGDTPDNPNSEPGCIYNSGYMVINGGTFKSQSGSYALIASGGTTIINGGTFEASRGAISATGQAYLEINGGTFTSNVKNSAYALYYDCDTLNATLKITGGTFNNAAGGYDAHIAGGEKIEIADGIFTKVTADKYNFAK